MLPIPFFFLFKPPRCEFFSAESRQVELEHSVLCWQRVAREVFIRPRTKKKAVEIIFDRRWSQAFPSSSWLSLSAGYIGLHAVMRRGRGEGVKQKPQSHICSSSAIPATPPSLMIGLSGRLLTHQQANQWLPA